MENWKRFLNEQKPLEDDHIWDKLQRLVPALEQDASIFFAGNDIDVKKITLAQMAAAGCDLPLIDMESVAAITLGDLFDKSGMPGQPPVEFAADEDTLEERGLGLGELRDTPPGDGFGDNDDGYPPERPLPKSRVGGKPPKPPTKKSKA